MDTAKGLVQLAGTQVCRDKACLSGCRTGRHGPPHREQVCGVLACRARELALPVHMWHHRGSSAEWLGQNAGLTFQISLIWNTGTMTGLYPPASSSHWLCPTTTGVALDEVVLCSWDNP